MRDCLRRLLSALSLALLLPLAVADDNPFRARVQPAADQARQAGTVEAFQEALDVAYRADAWQEGLSLAEAALKLHPEAEALHGAVLRALWRAGRIAQAEALAQRVPHTTEDRTTLAQLIIMRLARGDMQGARLAAERLDALGPRDVTQWGALAGERMQARQPREAGRLLEEVRRLADRANGYPDILLVEMLTGMPGFLRAIGDKPINQIVQPGEVEMAPAPMVRLPACMAYRLIIDTGGSITLSLDSGVAREIGLENLGDAIIFGVGGKDTSGQSLIDELRIGTAVCRRVLARTFDVRRALLNTADGILGTGIFADGRMTLDFTGGTMRLEASSERPAPGAEVDLLILGDGKLISPIGISGRTGLALYDTGASDVIAFSHSLIEALFPDTPVLTVPFMGMGVGSGGASSMSLGPAAHLDISGQRFEHAGGIGLELLDTLLSPALGTQVDVLIGMPVFSRMRTCTIDFPRSRMWAEWIEERE